MHHYRVLLDEAVSLGDLRHAESPGEPIILSLARYPAAPGLPKKEQLITGRRELLNTSFEFYEYSIRDQLGRILGGGGFDLGRDIFGIAVNRWPHGYSYTYNTLHEPWDWVFTSSDERPCVVGRQPYGQIAIAQCGCCNPRSASCNRRSDEFYLVDNIDPDEFTDPTAMEKLRVT